MMNSQYETIQTLYDQNRFLDAYQVALDCWPGNQAASRLSTEQLILLSRLAGRLGGRHIGQWLLRLAKRNSANHPLVRYFGLFSQRTKSIFEQIREFEKGPELDPQATPEVQASWFAHHAQLYAYVKDFERAQQCLQQAKQTGWHKPWIDCCEAEVLLASDRWDAGLSKARRAWQQNPGMPAAASVLGRALLKKGQFAQAVWTLTDEKQHWQSYETRMIALWHVCALAERGASNELDGLAKKARSLIRGLGDLCPLANRSCREAIALAKLDAAMVFEDNAQHKQHFASVRHPFYRAVLENRSKNPSGPRIVLDHQARFQKHLTCLPTSLATVLSTHQVTLDEDEMVSAITYDGTAIWRAMDWLKTKGLCCAPFIVNAAIAKKLIRCGVPFVLSFEFENFAHATAAIGVDESADTLLIHDPSAARRTQILLEHLDAEQRPVGPLGLAVVPPHKAEVLTQIPPSNNLAADAFHSYFRALATDSLSAAEKILNNFQVKAGDQPLTSRLCATHHTQCGNLAEAIEILEHQLSKHPNCLPLRKDLLSTLRQTDDSALIRRCLAGIVEQGRLPGTSADCEWRHPPAIYVAQYADCIGMTATQFERAERLLARAITHAPQESESYHILGDVYLRQGKIAQAVLPYRIAAHLDIHCEHFARAASDALRGVGLEEEGLDLLQKRCQQLGSLVDGADAWITLVDALMDYGHPTRAQAVMEQAQRQINAHGAAGAKANQGRLALFATQFWLRLGKRSRAGQSLQTVSTCCQRALYLEAHISYLRALGRWTEALPLVDEWLAEAPNNPRACQAKLALVARQHGRGASLKLAQQWLDRHPGNAGFERFLLEEFENLSLHKQSEQLIRKRVERDPYDVWAWRELGHHLIRRIELQPPQQQSAERQELGEVLGHCKSLAPDDVSTLALEARWASYQGKPRQAIEILRRAVLAEADFYFGYQRALEYANALTDHQREELLTEFEHNLIRVSGSLHGARDLALEIASRFGIERAERSVQIWLKHRPNDPQVHESLVDLWLEFGGQTKAQQALQLLERELARFGFHFGLRFSKAQALGILGRKEEQIQVLEALLHWDPRHQLTRQQLAMGYAAQGKTDQAEKLLIEGTQLDPLHPEGWSDLAQLRWDTHRYQQATKTVSQGLALQPQNIALRRQLLEYLENQGQWDAAVACARQGTQVCGQEAYMWYLLGCTLEHSTAHTDQNEVMACYQKALELNAYLFDAADALSVLLTATLRFEEARETIQRQIPALIDPCAALARLAWINRQAGQSQKAIEQIASVVKRSPANRFAYWHLLQWLEEDECWQQARSWLPEAPKLLATEPELCARRLRLLELAGLDRDQLEKEWLYWLSEFPADAGLHLHRFDQLSEAESWSQAGELIQHIAKHHPNDPFLLARKVRWLAKTAQEEAALETLEQIWLHPGDDERWPEHFGWQSIVEAGWQQPACQKMTHVLDQGQRVRVTAFELVIDEQVQRASKSRDSLDVDALRQWLPRLEKQNWDSGVFLAKVLDGLFVLGYHNEILDYVKKHREQCHSSTPLWQKVGYFYAATANGNMHSLRDWLADWRKRPGVEMWTLVNYIVGLRASGELDLILTCCKDALQRLPLDYTAQHLVCVWCEIAIRSQREHELHQALAEYGRILTDESIEYYRPSDYDWTPRVVRLFAELLECKEKQAVYAVCHKLHKTVSLKRRRAIRRFWHGQLRKQLGLWQRLRARLIVG